MTAIRPLAIARKRTSKYGNIRCQLDGFSSDSRAEMRHYCELRIREKADEIKGLRVHPAFPIQINGLVVCDVELDFMYTDMGLGRIVAIDVKGGRSVTHTPLSKLKHRLFSAAYGIPVEIVEIGR